MYALVFCQHVPAKVCHGMMFVADSYLFGQHPGILRQPQILCYVYLCICDT